MRRALSDETQSRPFQPLGGEVLHIGWLRTSEDGKVSRAEGESDRDCLELLLEHYTVDSERQEEILDRVVRGWSDVTLTLGDGYYCRLQRFSEFDTLTLSGPGNPEEPLWRAVRPWQWMLPEGWLATVPGKVFLCAHVVVRNTDTEDSLLVDENDLWNELQMVSNAVGWERRDRGYAEGETSRSAARDEALTAIAEMVTSDEEDMPAVLEWDSGSGSYDPDPGSLTEEERANLTWFQLAERQAEIGKKKAEAAVPVRGQGTGRRSMLPIIVTEQCIEEGGTVDECIEEAFTEEEVLPPELKPKKQKRNGRATATGRRKSRRSAFASTPALAPTGGSVSSGISARRKRGAIRWRRYPRPWTAPSAARASTPPQSPRSGSGGARSSSPRASSPSTRVAACDFTQTTTSTTRAACRASCSRHVAPPWSARLGSSSASSPSSSTA